MIFCSQLVFPWLLGFGLAEGCDSSASQIPGCVTSCSSSPARAQLPAPPKCFPGENDPEIGYYLAMKPQPCRWSPPRKPSLALDGILGGAPDIWAGLGSLSQDNCAPHGRGNVLSPSPLIIPGIVVISWQFLSLGDGTRLGWVSAVISSPLCSRSPGDERDLLPGFADLWERDKIGDKSTFCCSGLLEAFSRGENCWIAAFANSFCFSRAVTPKNNEGDQCRSPMGGAELQKLGYCVSQEHFLQDLSCPGPCSSCLCCCLGWCLQRDPLELQLDLPSCRNSSRAVKGFGIKPGSRNPPFSPPSPAGENPSSSRSLPSLPASFPPHLFPVLLV